MPSGKGLIKSHRVDFDGDPLKLVQSCFSISDEYMQPRLRQYRRDYQIFNAYLDMTNLNPDLAHVFIPKVWSLVRTKVPLDVRALGGHRPYLPFQSRRKEYRMPISVWELQRPRAEVW